MGDVFTQRKRDHDVFLALNIRETDSPELIWPIRCEDSRIAERYWEHRDIGIVVFKIKGAEYRKLRDTRARKERPRHFKEG